MLCRSSLGRLLSHSRAGSLPATVLKKITSRGRSDFNHFELYHI